MDCVKIPNTNALKRISPAGENKKINFFPHEKSQILSMLKMSGMELGENCLVETRPSADKHESPAEKNVVTSDSTRKRQKKASQTSCDPLEKLSADVFGILHDISQDKAIRCDEMEQLLKDISDRKVTEETLYRNLVEYYEEQEALPPPPPPTKFFSSNLVPMDDGKVPNTNALKQISPAGENKKINFFPDFQHEKSQILSMLKMSGMELGENCLVETRPSADKHESPAEKNVVTSDSTRKRQKKASQTSCDPLEKLSADVFGILHDISQDKAIRCDEMEQLLKDISDRKVTEETLYRNLVEYYEEQETLPPPPPPTKVFSSNLVPMDDGKVPNTNALKQISPAGENKKINFFPDFQHEKSQILSMLKMSGMVLGENCGESLVETRPSADKHESPAEKNVVTSDSALKQRD